MIRVMKESMVRCRIMTFDLKGDLLVLLLIEFIIIVRNWHIDRRLLRSYRWLINLN